MFDEDANRGQTNTSDFSQNLLKYGIRKMNRAPVKLENKTGYWPNVNAVPTTVMWEHDSMNIMEAQDISYHLQQKAVHFKLDCWQLDLHSYNMQQVLPLEHNAQWPKVECNVDINVAHGFIRDYIENKLNTVVKQGNKQ